MPNSLSKTILLENSGESCIGLSWPITALSKPSPETSFSKPSEKMSFENWDYVRVGAPTAQRTHRRYSAHRGLPAGGTVQRRHQPGQRAGRSA